MTKKVKVNFDHFIIYSTGLRPQNPNSMSNLKQNGLSSPTSYIGKKSAKQLEDLVKNWLLSNQKKNAENKALAHMPPQTQPANPTHGGTVASAHVLSNELKENVTGQNTEGGKLLQFSTLTCQQRAETIEDESKIGYAFSVVTLILTKLKLNYVWRVEKSYNNHLHYHIIHEGDALIVAEAWRRECKKYQLGGNEMHDCVTKTIGNEQSDAKALGIYMSKGSVAPILRGKHWSSSFGVRKFKSRTMTLEAFTMMRDTEHQLDLFAEKISENEFYSVYKSDNQIIFKCDSDGDGI